MASPQRVPRSSAPHVARGGRALGPVRPALRPPRPEARSGRTCVRACACGKGAAARRCHPRGGERAARGSDPGCLPQHPSGRALDGASRLSGPAPGTGTRRAPSGSLPAPSLDRQFWTAAPAQAPGRPCQGQLRFPPAPGAVAPAVPPTTLLGGSLPSPEGPRAGPGPRPHLFPLHVCRGAWSRGRVLGVQPSWETWGPARPLLPAWGLQQEL